MKLFTIKKPRAQEGGFTLIELVMVIVILGILAAVAIPKFVDLSKEARLASAKTLAGSISSSSAIFFSAIATGNPEVANALVGGIPINGTVDAESLTMMLLPGWQPFTDNITVDWDESAPGVSDKCDMVNHQGLIRVVDASSYETLAVAKVYCTI